MRRIPFIFKLSSVLPLLFLLACSTQKNTMVSRSYHNLTSHYNVYFNGNEAMKNGIRKINSSWIDNYSVILPPFKWTDPKVNRTASGDMEKAIKKGSKLIKLHSITTKPKRKKGKMTPAQRDFYKKNEYNNWVDDAYLMIGKGHFFRSDYYSAVETFEYVIKQFNEQPIRYDGMLWLARTYNEMKKYDKSRELLDLIENDKKVPKKLKPELAITYADYFLKQGYYSEAVPHLESAVRISRKKADKNRYRFILAQIFQKNNEVSKASRMFGEVIKANTSYELTFNARLARAGLYSSGQGGGVEFMKELGKMLKDEKNKEYRDQIYYVLGNIALKDRDTTTALENYKLSTEASINNLSQKAMSFLAAADIYFARPDYRNSQALYDSTLFFLDEKYPDYKALSQKSANLNKLIENIRIVEEQDSLQRVAAMPEAERNKFIDGIIEQVKKAEEKQKELERQTQQNFMAQKQQQYDPRYQNMMSGKWYFYNPTALSFGQSEFQKVWGRRKLEDNWRRKNKAVVVFTENLEEEEEEGETKKKPTDNKSREFYMVDLPINDSLKTISTGKIIDASFSIGEIYKSDFEDYNNSIKAYTKLNERFPQNVYLLSAYYNLYKLYRIIGNESKADEYKNLIISKFPNSKYARMFTNPNFLAEMEAEQNKVKELYGNAYTDYKRKAYAQALRTIAQVEKEYPDNDLKAKFMLMKGLATGEQGQLEQMVPILKDLIQQFPDSEEKVRAREILLRLKKEGHEIAMDQKEEESGEKPKVAETKIYEMDEKTVHYYLLVGETKALDINRLKFNVSNFNIEKFAASNFNVSSVVLNDTYQIITVKSFPTSRKAMEYFQVIKSDPEIFRDVKAGSYYQFVISMKNFGTFFKDQNIETYQAFFEENYRSK